MIYARCLTAYAGGRPVVRCADLEVAGGEVALLFGPTGGGKSALVKAMAGLLPRKGEVRLERPYFVFQDVDVNLIATTVREEVRTVSCGGEGLPDTPLERLSPGQRQLLSVELAALSRAGAVVLDEPTAFLDPASARAVRDRIFALAEEGRAVLVVEHRLELFLDADRLYLVEGGRAAEVELEDLIARSAAGGWGPYFVRGRRPPLYPLPRVEGCPAEVRGVPVRPGAKVALTGPVGSGKTYTLLALAGVVKLRGTRGCSPVGYVPQNPYMYFTAPDLRRAPPLVLEALGVERWRSPFSLSAGEARLAALLWEISRWPRLLLVDEPTAGVDRRYAEWVGEVVRAYGGTVVFASHDPVFVSRYADAEIRLG
ncbi:ATP-binding cassette domain-containing protein [Pyrobaculum neutrophilum]|uniref:ABC transporter related n=1 Tax=Pyrobaculum neutrophilum (strain DSM 2338 / JCM 9278 / NBRC 100436 / V24Sta) TaxID=444157 RepID=B1YBA5_PYRNV|nr:ATP-binding cassette domain-containing protein [Pyrobaculum neutrophilum]ACB39236.1 ABC transporter related [Pyrobaculum neutrophilum V24Sta]